jgi:hypothetical protein
MQVFRLEDALAVFRGVEDNQDAVVVIGDDDAMRVLVAWTHVDNDWYPPSTACPPLVHGKLAAAWDWIRAGWDLNERKISKLAGVPTSVARAKLDVLIGNRLIYPDGSLSKGVRLALAAFTAQRLGLKPSAATGEKKKPPTSSDDREDN